MRNNGLDKIADVNLRWAMVAGRMPGICQEVFEDEEDVVRADEG